MLYPDRADALILDSRPQNCEKVDSVVCKPPVCAAVLLQQPGQTKTTGQSCGKIHCEIPFHPQTESTWTEDLNVKIQFRKKTKRVPSMLTFKKDFEAHGRCQMEKSRHQNTIKRRREVHPPSHTINKDSRAEHAENRQSQRDTKGKNGQKGMNMQDTYFTLQDKILNHNSN